MGGPDRRSSSRIHRWHVRPALLGSWLVPTCIALVMHVCIALVMHVWLTGLEGVFLGAAFLAICTGVFWRGEDTTLAMQQMIQSRHAFIARFPWLITRAREKAYDINSNYPFLFCWNSLLTDLSLTSFFHFVWFAGSGSGEAVAGALWPRRWQLHISHVQGQNSVACTTSCIPHLSPLQSLSS